MKKSGWLGAFVLTFWLVSAAFGNVYVKNKPFKGGVSGKGAATIVEAEPMLKALGADGYKLEGQQLTIGEKVLKLEGGMISLKDLTDAIGAKMVVNASMGTIDVYQPAIADSEAGPSEKGSKAQGSWGAGQWHTTWDAAAAESRSSGKPILINFTGSDWCGWCVRLKKEVFSTDTFSSWASSKVVLLEIDFPRKKAQSAQVRAANSQLATKFGVTGYPSIFFANAKGDKIGTRLGYMEGGPSAWTRQAEQMMRSR